MSIAAQGLVHNHRVASPKALSKNPKQRAISGETNFAGMGRDAVRAINASSFRSIHWLRAAAPPAASPVPMVRAKNSTRSERKGSCTKKPKEAVNTESKLSRGFVNSYNPLKLIDLSASNAADAPELMFLVRFTRVTYNNVAGFASSKVNEN